MTKPIDVINLARSQIGVAEDPPYSNHVKYNNWYYQQEVSGPEYPWCMVFVQWVFYIACNPLPKETGSCSELLNWFREHMPECVVSDPMPGDIVIYNFGHTGIVTEVHTDIIQAIEGNTSADDDSNGGCVLERMRPYSTVEAYIRYYPGLNLDMEAAKQWAVDNHIVIGVDETTFTPDWKRPITREEAVTILYRYHRMLEGYVQI